MLKVYTITIMFFNWYAYVCNLQRVTSSTVAPEPMTQPSNQVVAVTEMRAVCWP